MTKSEDIVNLFQQFGGQVDDYQELSRQQSAAQAKKRWPLLSALEVGQTMSIVAPGVAEAEAPVTAGPIEFRPAPIAPPAPVLAPSGQHLSAAELALSTSAPAPTPSPAPALTPAPASPPAAVPAPAPVQATFAPAPATAAVPVMPSPTPAATFPTQATVPAPSPRVAAAWTWPAATRPAHLAESSPPAMAAPVAPSASPPPAPVAAQVPLPPPLPQALSSTSPLASLAHGAQAPAPAPTEPTTELQGIFNRLAGRAEPAPPSPAPSGLAALWQNLRGGA